MDPHFWTPISSCRLGAFGKEVPQWRRRARMRQRKTALVTIPSSHPRMAVKMTIQTSDTVDVPTTQLNSTRCELAIASATKQTSSATAENA
jgi:hypothetical protein